MTQKPQKFTSESRYTLESLLRDINDSLVDSIAVTGMDARGTRKKWQQHCQVNIVAIIIQLSVDISHSIYR